MPAHGWLVCTLFSDALHMLSMYNSICGEQTAEWIPCFHGRENVKEIGTCHENVTGDHASQQAGMLALDDAGGMY